MAGDNVAEAKTERREQAALSRELRALDATLLRARRMLDSGEEDFVQLGALVVRLCDSIARLQLAQQKIRLGEDTLAHVRAELHDVLVAMGLGAPGAGKGGNGNDKREH